MDYNIIVIAFLFFIVAILYGSAGFGGGSSYLAILALFELEYLDLRMIALCCNIVVVTGTLWLFWKNGYFDRKKMWPLVILSIPFAYLGGFVQLSESSFFILLGIILMIGSFLMLMPKEKKWITFPMKANALIGGGIGFLSGVVGIGGGIFLSPILHLSAWDKAKKIACATAFFILVNSMAGLVGQISAHSFQVPLQTLLPLLFAVFIGGQIGSRLGAFRFTANMIRQISAVLIFVVSIRILYTSLF